MLPSREPTPFDWANNPNEPSYPANGDGYGVGCAILHCPYAIQGDEGQLDALKRQYNALLEQLNGLRSQIEGLSVQYSPVSAQGSRFQWRPRGRF